MEIRINIKITRLMESGIYKALTKKSIPDHRINERKKYTHFWMGRGMARTEEILPVMVPKEKASEFVRIVNKGSEKMYVLNDTGIYETGSGRKTEYLWADFWSISYNFKYLFLKLSSPEGYFVIPKKCLAPGEQDELQCFLESSYRDKLNRKFEKI